MHLLFDRASLLDRIDGDEGLLQELLALFLRVQPGRVAALGEALAKPDLAALRAGAHQLAGAFDSLSMMPAGALCQRIEQHALEGNLSVCQTLLTDLGRVFDETRAAVCGDDLGGPTTTGPAATHVGLTLPDTTLPDTRSR